MPRYFKAILDGECSVPDSYIGILKYNQASRYAKDYGEPHNLKRNRFWSSYYESFFLSQRGVPYAQSAPQISFTIPDNRKKRLIIKVYGIWEKRNALSVIYLSR